MPMNSDKLLAHPLPLDAIVTLLRVHDGRFVTEGLATILRRAPEPNTYLVQLRGDARIRTRLIFPEYQHATSRFVDILNQHLDWDAGRAFPSHPQPESEGRK